MVAAGVDNSLKLRFSDENDFFTIFFRLKYLPLYWKYGTENQFRICTLDQVLQCF